MPTPDSPELQAMRDAMRAAEDAAEKRRLAKLAAREAEPLDAGDNWRDVLSETAVRHAEDFHWEAEEEDTQPRSFTIEGDDDLTRLIADAAAHVPERDDLEVHGDLTILHHEQLARAWYTEAAEDALPAPLRAIKGPIDVKMMLQALIVEVGDVKRTNSLLMEMVTRLEEKVDRANRLLRERHVP